MANIIISVILILIVGLAAFYIYKSKKNGSKCIGCPHSRQCSSSKNGKNCGCNS